MEKKSPWLTTFKNRFYKVTASLLNKETATFLLFFILAFALWMLHSIGSRRELTVRIPVEYNIPENIRVKENLPKEINITLKDEGNVLIRYLFGVSIDTAHINLEPYLTKDQGLYTYSLDSVRTALLSHLSSTTQIAKCEPQSIYVDYVLLSTKKVPLRLSDSIVLAPQYLLADSISMDPSFVSIYGEASKLDSLSFIPVAPLGLKALDKTTELTQKLILPKNVRANHTSTKITIPVEIATEKTISIPIKSTNQPAGLFMRTFPAMAQVTFLINISRFNTITETDFTIEADYSLRTTEIYCPIYITKQPEGIYNLRIEPSEVEFSLEDYNSDIF